ncbi:MAG TPA: hypothetical protein VKD90_05920 [Gemmataceae bacterium]|nr:hypothetical protein [Gemmataceae bacterium]
MRSLSLALTLFLADVVRAADSSPPAPRSEPGLFAWYLVFVSAILAAGIGLVPDWVRRRRRDRAIRGAVAVPVREPAAFPGPDRRPRNLHGTSP